MYLPIPATGFKALRQGLVTDTYFEGMLVEKSKVAYSEMVGREEIDMKIDAFIAGEGWRSFSQPLKLSSYVEETNSNCSLLCASHAGGDIYERLARSIAPEIFGHEDVKKALLLLLVGGVTRSMPDGVKIRGG